MKQINMLESPVRQVFFSYLVPSISATLVTSIYILADTMMIGRGVGGSGIAAMNILLPYGMKYNYDICKKEYGKLLLPLAGAEVYAKTEEKDRAKESIRTILKMRKKLYRMCGLPTHLREAGVKPEQFEAVARAAVNDGAMIVNPKAAGIEDVLKILAEAY